MGRSLMRVVFLLICIVTFSMSVVIRAAGVPHGISRTPSSVCCRIEDADIGDTWFAVWDGRDDDGISPEGTFPPGDDLLEREMKRMFNIDSSPNSSIASDEVAELQLMFKLRKELGDEDFKRIFDHPRIRGVDVW
eukprot:CAMPEP_0119312128 /NCGR_PEP_ID=MMETSP1333-20130426/25124_1 /TAXON_ID=418940 /ORGANISM="Scyphosphaera apsteinii, Strain RCC1455" /LENGTH=134 /DNA_ID=CAMNT_0007316693 /DNA_START=60 /DNA_END=461 /DNA_ORIENTATION=-